MGRDEQLWLVVIAGFGEQPILLVTNLKLQARDSESVDSMHAAGFVNTSLLHNYYIGWSEDDLLGTRRQLHACFSAD